MSQGKEKPRKRGTKPEGKRKHEKPKRDALKLEKRKRSRRLYY